MKENEKENDLPMEYKRRLKQLCPQLPQEMSERAKIVWEAASFAYHNARPGEPSHIAVVARALREAEVNGPRIPRQWNVGKGMGEQPDPVKAVAVRILAYAVLNSMDPHHVLADISKSLVENG